MRPSASFYPESMATLAGPSDLWARLFEMNNFERQRALEQFISRVLYPRLRIDDGDESTTLLPPGMLAAYQGIMTKSEDTVARPENIDNGGREVALNMRHCWRGLTAFWTSDVCNGYKVPTTIISGEMPDTDPRMPRILALEELLRGALDPFAGFSSNVLAHIEPGQQAELAAGTLKVQDLPHARKAMREVTDVAAQLVLACFACVTPTEVYWPHPEQPDRPGVAFITKAMLARTHNVGFGVRQLIYPEVILGEWHHGSPDNKYYIVDTPYDTTMDERKGRVELVSKVIRSQGHGMSAWTPEYEDEEGLVFSDVELSPRVLDIQVALGWIKEGEPGLRTASRHNYLPDGWELGR